MAASLRMLATFPLTVQAEAVMAMLTTVARLAPLAAYASNLLKIILFLIPPLFRHPLNEASR
jgi:hypothetical protein